MQYMDDPKNNISELTATLIFLIILFVILNTPLFFTNGYMPVYITSAIL